MTSVLTTASLRLSHVHKIGGPITSALERRRINETLYQVRTITEVLLKIIRQPLQHLTEHPRRQIMAALRAQQKTAHAHYPVQLGTPRWRIPANPGIPVTQLQSRCRKAKTTQPTVCRMDQIAQLSTHQRPGATRMFAQHQLIPQASLRVMVDQHQLEALHRASRLRYLRR